MLSSALLLAVGLLPSAFSQFAPECSTQCKPVEDYLAHCTTLPRAEGMPCLLAVCTAATTLDQCVACSVSASGAPPAQYYGMLGCPVIPPPTTVPPTTTPPQATRTCTRKGKGHCKGKGHENHDDSDDSDNEC
ncbi:hypothetical protein CspeluHIS016_0113490 [Cutaneotrichosporon spelunceum]|uniref:Extracellular membrane protein CFEM domain-containing protein n=1 Tax=Cutaneotrichosporon spelunceum TaxID=1672016 RepID=A0AAD3TPS7_9TREE|nr:hypothetical protein CspeluHIS016_0113490 [Cutaneotrichosporon spelunceum]